ncbi:MAG: carboxypeptidase regulatory-like domain-containing protein [Acidobacteria bacterium]|nr:carboxypeptidase regulatory-like domain-containing protein [Acidobacteriota bacterium]
MRKIAGVFLLSVAIPATPAQAQIQVFPTGGEPMQMPMPQPGRQMKTGTARIKGRLVGAETGAPVRRAQVRISGPEIMPKAATTDNDGVYELRDLPAGRYTVNATKSGYVSVGYGQSRPFESGKTIELTDGQVLEKADITMPRGSVISGRIIDEFGEPVADAAVSAMRSSWSNGKRRLQNTGRTATTNDLGQFRLYGLPPGDYYVSATLRGTQEMIVAEMAMIAMSTGGASESPRSGYAPTYYPGTANGAEAQKLTLAVGQEAQNTDFGLIPVRLAKISGAVVGSDGRPLEGVAVSATPRSAAVGSIIFPSGGSGRTDKNGNFTLSGVSPGDYTLSARTSGVVSTTGDGDRMVFTMTRTMGTGGGGDGVSETGSVPLSVSGDDLTNVMIVTSKGTTVTGKVVYEGGSKPTTNTLRISAAAMGADGPLAALGGGSSSVTPDGTFEMKGLSGPRIFRVSNIPAGWVLKAVRLNGTDVTDNGIDVRPTDPVNGVEVVLTSKSTEVTGSVKAGNDPATDYTVVIFSDDPDKWTAPMTRHVVSARPNQEGRFQVKHLPAGTYYVVALDYIPQGDWNDPDVLERLKPKATRLSLTEGDVQNLALTLDSM